MYLCEHVSALAMASSNPFHSHSLSCSALLLPYTSFLSLLSPPLVFSFLCSQCHIATPLLNVLFDGIMWLNITLEGSQGDASQRISLSDMEAIMRPLRHAHTNRVLTHWPASTHMCTTSVSRVHEHTHTQRRLQQDAHHLHSAPSTCNVMQ